MIARDTMVLEGLIGIPSEPSRCMAELLLKEGAAKNPGPWKEHSHAVAEAAEKLALAVNQNCGKEKMNPNLAYIYGLLHDIGRQEGFCYIAHVYKGYHFMMSFGYKNVARICLTHSFQRQIMDDWFGTVDLPQEKMNEIENLLGAIQYDDYDRMIQLLDSICAADGTKNLELRIADIKSRYGSYPQGKKDKNFKLKEYFEKLAGKNIYNVI